MSRKKGERGEYEKPLALDMDPDEALERFARTDVRELKAAQEMTIVEDAESGDRILVYGTDLGVHVELKVTGETFWASQAQMAEMFGVDQSRISRHISNIFADGELREEDSIMRFPHNTPGKPPVHYNLNVVISVGYRVESKLGTMFRLWATDKLFRYLTKGFVVDVRRMKEGGDASRLKEFRDLARDIRSEQRNVHDELNDICSYCADYDKDDPVWATFFKNTSAKIFHAATHTTPSEIIHDRADATLENMGLITWSGARVIKKDVTVAKNYLQQAELEELNRFSSMLLDYMEDQAKRGRLVKRVEAEAEIDKYTAFTGRVPLRGGGSVSRTQADAKAHAQYAIFDAARRAEKRALADAETPDQITEVKAKTLAPPKAKKG